MNFRHGLSYTTFRLEDLSIITPDSSAAPLLSFSVTNIGSRSGSEVVQVYISSNASRADYSEPVSRARKELRGFSKIFLLPGEAKKVELQLDRFAGVYWSEDEDTWILQARQYEILVGTSSAEKDIKLRGTWTVGKDSSWTGL